jgi:hypothetical protein
MDWLQSIVRIGDSSGGGSGFVISSNGLIVTCAHVLGGERPEKVKLVFHATEQERTATVIEEWWRATDAEDVAFLRLEGELPEGVVPLPLCSSVGTSGHVVSTFGYPALGDVEGARSTGKVLGLGAQMLPGHPLLQLNASEITEGFSGAPVWDEMQQCVIGMIVMVARPDSIERLRSTSFAIPVETLRTICPVLQISAICPYRSLDTFNEVDAAFFYGRERIVEELVRSLQNERRFLAVFGPSGCGKSSVVRAGLLPRLRAGAIPGSDTWAFVATRPTDQSFQRIITHLSQSSPPTPMALVIDQFEEIFVAHTEDQTQEILAHVVRILENPRITLIFTMRDDFYSRFVKQEELAQWIKRGVVNISPVIQHDEISEMIQAPAQVVGLRFEEGLVETIINDALEKTYSGSGQKTGSSTILPLLEFALTQLWERRQDGVLTHRDYERIGGVAGGLTQWADQAYYNVDELHRPIVRHIFTSLVHLGEEDQHIPDSRRRRTLTSLVNNQADQSATYELVQRMVAMRLLVISQDAANKEETVEIIHDALLSEWGLLKHWLAEDRRFLKWHEKIEERVNEWIATNTQKLTRRDTYKLLGGRDLVEAVQWQTERRGDLSKIELDFIAVSKRRQRSALNRLRFFVGALSIFSIAVIVLASVLQWNLSQVNVLLTQVKIERQAALNQANTANVHSLAAQSSARIRKSRSLYHLVRAAML